jgi:hypothetical protein
MRQARSYAEQTHPFIPSSRKKLLMKTFLSIIGLLSLCACTKPSTLNITPVVSNSNTVHSYAKAITTSATYQLVSFAAAKTSSGSKITWTAVGETNINGYNVQVGSDRAFSAIASTTSYTSSNSIHYKDTLP